MTTTFVDPDVTRQKVQRELDLWKVNSNHQERGWLLLNFDEGVPSIELAFLAKIAINAGIGFLPVVVCSIRLTYENYDLWPPSLTFIDIFSRQPTKPHVRAIMSTPEGPRDVLIDGHPATNRPFLCLPGIREYHSHPQHTGDDWILHRPAREGSLSTICERIWRLMSKNVLGLSVSIQALPVWPLQAQLSVQLAQGEVIDRAAAGIEDASRLKGEQK
jgi:hypothetical protein